MNKKDEEIQDQIIKGMYKIFDKLEQRISPNDGPSLVSIHPLPIGYSPSIS